MAALLRMLQWPLRQDLSRSGVARVRTNTRLDHNHYSDSPIYQEFFEDLIKNPPPRPLLRSSVFASRLSGR